MMYFPGSASGATAGRSGTGGATLDQLQRRAQQVSLKGATPSQNRPPASDPRMRAALAQTFAGSSLNTTLEAGAARPHTGGGGERGDPASPAHRDAAGSRGGNRSGASPYGALVPRQHAGNRKAVGGSGYGTPLHASQGRGAPTTPHHRTGSPSPSLLLPEPRWRPRSTTPRHRLTDIF